MSERAREGAAKDAVPSCTVLCCLPKQHGKEEEQGVVQVVLRLVDAGRTAVLEAFGELLLLGQAGGA